MFALTPSGHQRSAARRRTYQRRAQPAWSTAMSSAIWAARLSSSTTRATPPTATSIRKRPGFMGFHFGSPVLARQVSRAARISRPGLHARGVWLGEERRDGHVDATLDSDKLTLTLDGQERDQAAARLEVHRRGLFWPRGDRRSPARPFADLNVNRAAQHRSAIDAAHSRRSPGGNLPAPKLRSWGNRIYGWGAAPPAGISLHHLSSKGLVFGSKGPILGQKAGKIGGLMLLIG